MFWILSISLTVLVIASVVWPLVQPRPPRANAGGGRDAEVYAAQLAELDADVRRGAIPAEEAGSARAEIGRRLLRAVSQDGERLPGRERTLPLATGIVLAVALPVAGLALYGQLGSPHRSDLPLAARTGGEPNVDPSQGGDIRTMVAAAEARLAENPQDGRGWDVLAPIYARLGDLARAESAYRDALRLLGETPARLSGLGEVLVRGAGGEVTDEARALFAQAQALDPQALTPRLFLALDLTQDGRAAEAGEAWRAILAEAPEDAPWRPMAQAALAEAEGRGGPSAESVAERAAAVPEGGEAAMIEGMVAGLASRLEAEPDDADGWTRLVHAYGVLGDKAAGQAALAQARRAFPTGTEEWARIADAAARAGLVVSTQVRP